MLPALEAACRRSILLRFVPLPQGREHLIKNALQVSLVELLVRDVLVLHAVRFQVADNAPLHRRIVSRLLRRLVPDESYGLVGEKRGTFEVTFGEIVVVLEFHHLSDVDAHCVLWKTSIHKPVIRMILAYVNCEATPIVTVPSLAAAFSRRIVCIIVRVTLVVAIVFCDKPRPFARWNRFR